MKLLLISLSLSKTQPDRNFKHLIIAFHLTCSWGVVLCRAEAEGSMKGILGFTEDDVVSTDFVGDCR